MSDSSAQGAAASSSSQDIVEEKTGTSHVTEDELKDMEEEITLPVERDDAEATGSAVVKSMSECQTGDRDNAAGPPVLHANTDRGVTFNHDESHSPPIKFSKPGGTIFTVRQSKDDLSKDFALNLLPNMHKNNNVQISDRKEQSKEQDSKGRDKNDRRISEVTALPTSRRTQRASTVAGLTSSREPRQRSCSFALNSVSAHSTLGQIQAMAEAAEAIQKKSRPEKDEHSADNGKKQRGRSCSFALNSVSNHSTMHQIQQLAVGKNSDPRLSHLSHLSKCQTLPAFDTNAQPKLEKKGSQSSDEDSSEDSSDDESDPGAEAEMHVKSVRILGHDHSDTTAQAPAQHTSAAGDMVRRLSRMIPFGGFFQETAQQPQTIMEETQEDGENLPRKPTRRFSRAINATVTAAIANEHDEGDETHLPWIFTSQANTFFGALIIVNAAWMGAETDHVQRLPEWFWLSGESIFLLLFGVEIILRYRFHRRMPLGIDEEPMGFFKYVWNVLDLTIVFTGVVDTWIMTILVKGILGVNQAGSSGVSIFSMLQLFRILRLLRIIRIFRFLKDLVLLAQGIYAAIKGLQGAAMLLAMTLYIFSIFATRFLGQFKVQEEDVEPLPEDADLLKMWFGTVHESLFTLFQLATLENWPDVTRTCMHIKGWYTAFFFISFLIVTHFVLLNLVTGVILENVMAISRREEEKALQREEAERIQTVMKIHKLFDAVLGQLHDGELFIEDFRQACLNPRVVRQLQDLQIATHEAEELFVLMDTSKRGCIDIDHFIEGCLRIRGVARAKHLLGVQYDVQKVWSKLSEQLDEVEDRLMECLEVLLEENEDRAEQRTSMRGSQLGYSRGSMDQGGGGRISARRSGRGAQSQVSRSSMDAGPSRVSVPADPVPAIAVGGAVAVGGTTAAGSAAAVASSEGSEEDQVVSDSSQTAAAFTPVVATEIVQPKGSGGSKKSRSRASCEAPHKLSTGSIPGAMEVADADVATHSGRMDDFAAPERGTLKKSRSQAFLKKSWSKSGTQDLEALDAEQVSSSTGLNAEKFNAQKAQADKAMARLMALQREEDRLRSRLEKVQQAREAELLWLQRYLLEAGGAGTAPVQRSEPEKENTWATARSMPAASQPSTVPSLDRPTLPLSRDAALSPAPFETGNASPSSGLQRQRRVSLGGDTLAATTAAGTAGPGRRVSVAHTGASQLSPGPPPGASMRRPSMGLGLLDMDTSRASRRTSLAHGMRGLPSMGERQSMIGDEPGILDDEDEESEHESSEAPSDKET